MFRPPPPKPPAARETGPGSERSYWHVQTLLSCYQLPTCLFDRQVYDAHLLPGHNVLKAMNLVAGSTIGVFKCDLGTVYGAPGASCFVTLRSRGRLFSCEVDPGSLGVVFRCPLSAATSLLKIKAVPKLSVCGQCVELP